MMLDPLKLLGRGAAKATGDVAGEAAGAAGGILKVPGEWTHVTPPDAMRRRLMPQGALPRPVAPAETWANATPETALQRRNMGANQFQMPPNPELAAPPATPPVASPIAATRKPMSLKKKIGIGAGIGAAGWIGNDMTKSFIAPQMNPQQYQTASDDELMDRLQKTAEHGDMEVSAMGIMERLEKTAEKERGFGEDVGRGAVTGAGVGGALTGLGTGTKIGVDEFRKTHNIPFSLGMGAAGLVGGGLVGLVPGAAVGSVAGGIKHMVHGEHNATANLMSALEKTADVVEAIHELAQATGASPEEIAQLADEDPDQFIALHQQMTGGQGAQEDAGDQGAQAQPSGAAPAQPQPGGPAPAQPQQAAPQDPTQQQAPEAVPQAPAETSDPSAIDQSEAQPVVGATPQMSAPPDQIVQQPQDPAALQPPMAPQPGSTMAVQPQIGGSMNDNSAILQAISQAASEGAAQGAATAIQQMGGGQDVENPRAGAASVSHNPAGVDKTASTSPDVLITRLEKSVDALTDVTKAMRSSNQDPNEPDQEQVKTAALMAALEKTAEGEEFADDDGGFLHEVGKGIAGGVETGGLLGSMAGAGYGLHEALKAPTIPLKVVQGLLNIPVGALIGGVAGQIVGGAAGALHGGIQGTLGAIGTQAMGEEEPEITEEHEASEALMASLEKTAAGMMGAIGNLSGKVMGAGKKYLGDVTGKNLGVAKDQLATWNTPKALVTNSANPNVGVSGFRNHLENLDKNVATVQQDTTNARKNTAIAGGGLLAGAAGSSLLAPKKQEKTASDEAEKGKEAENENLEKGKDDEKVPFLGGPKPKEKQEKTAASVDAAPSLKGYGALAGAKAQAQPTTAEGPAGQEGLEGYSAYQGKDDSKPIDKKAAENEEFMNGIFKEAAAHIIQIDMPKIKVHVDPMHRIKF